jgi:hypothetical protein
MGLGRLTGLWLQAHRLAQRDGAGGILAGAPGVIPLRRTRPYGRGRDAWARGWNSDAAVALFAALLVPQMQT